MRAGTIALCLVFMCGPTMAEAVWRRYVNPRFGVTAEYPSKFSLLDPEPANGDGWGGARLEVQSF
jgi:hypothetical protein